MGNQIKNIPHQHRSIDLCCGGGGASLGIAQAGFKGILGIDCYKAAALCHKANFPDQPVILKRMEDVSASEILKLTGLKIGDLEHLHCSWPCNEYSSANTKLAKNPPTDINRNFFHFLDKIVALQPMTFTGENVDGVLLGAKKKYFNEVINALKKLENYEFQYKVMNAIYYGVPQNRTRLLVIGKRRDVAQGIPIEFPKPNYAGADKLRLKNVMPHITLYKPGQFGKKAIHNSHFMCTITASNNILLYDGEWRRMTISEAKFFMGFPQNFKLVSKAFTTNMRLLGNAVPPPMMAAVMNNIKETILKNR